MKSVYIAGPYTAETREGEDANIKQAAAVAAEYIRNGWAVFCPHTIKDCHLVNLKRILHGLGRHWLIIF